MSHEVETMAWANTVPWHGLGTKVADDLSPEQMMKAAGLDWDVIEVPTYADYEGQKIATGGKALIRSTDQRVLTQVGSGWNPVQNSEAFEFFDEMCRAGDMKMETAGSLKMGEIVFVLAKIEKNFTLFGGDRVESFLLFSNPHQYGKSIDIRFTPIRVVCNNTLTMATGMKAEKGVRLNHRRVFDPAQVKELLGLVNLQMDRYQAAAETLGGEKYTREKLVSYFGDVFGKGKRSDDGLSRTGDLALRITEEQPGAEYAPGTWWNAFNAVTYITDHVSGRESDTRMQSAWFGANQRRKTAALDRALEYATV